MTSPVLWVNATVTSGGGRRLEYILTANHPPILTVSSLLVASYYCPLRVR